MLHSKRDPLGPRLTQLLVHPSVYEAQTSENETNLLTIERDEARRRIESLRQLSEEPLEFQSVKQGKCDQHNYDKTRTKLAFINGKTVSHEELLYQISTRFQKCLKTKSQEHPELSELSDSQLVHQVCRTERLTYFNFLMDHHRDLVGFQEEQIKRLIHREYAVYFKKTGTKQGYVRDLDIYGNSQIQKLVKGNSFEERFSVEFKHI